MKLKDLLKNRSELRGALHEWLDEKLNLARAGVDTVTADELPKLQAKIENYKELRALVAAAENEDGHGRGQAEHSDRARTAAHIRTRALGR